MFQFLKYLSVLEMFLIISSIIRRTSYTLKINVNPTRSEIYWYFDTVFNTIDHRPTNRTHSNFKIMWLPLRSINVLHRLSCFINEV